MTWTQIREAIHQRLATIQDSKGGLVFRLKGRGQNIQVGEPTSIHSYPFLFTLFDERDEEEDRGIREITYTASHHICFQSQNLNQAELDLEYFVDIVPDAVNDEPTLGGLLSPHGKCRIGQGKAGWAYIGDGQVPTRCLVFKSISVVRKGKNK